MFCCQFSNADDDNDRAYDTAWRGARQWIEKLVTPQIRPLLCCFCFCFLSHTPPVKN